MMNLLKRLRKKWGNKNMPKKLTPYQIMRLEMDRNYIQQYNASHRAVKPVQARAYTQTPSAKQQAQMIMAKNTFRAKKIPLYQQIGMQDFDQLNTKDINLLKEDIRKLQSVANSRITKLQKADEYDFNFAINKRNEKYLNDDGKFKFDISKINNRNQLLGYFNELNRFINYQSSTVKGIKKIRENVNKRIGIPFTKIQQDKFWEIYNKLKETAGGGKDGMNNLIKYLGFDDSKQLQRYIASMKGLLSITDNMSDDDVDAIVDDIAINITNYYNKKKHEYEVMEQRELAKQGLGSNVFNNMRKNK